MKEDKYTVLLDSNIIIDLLSNRKTNYPLKDFILLFTKKIIEGYICAKQITDIYYVLKKYIKSKSLRKELIQKLIYLFDILDFNVTHIIEGLLMDGYDFEDNILISVATQNKINNIVTNNIKDFKKSNIKVMKPNDLMQLLRN